ncbi:hypothetical protein Dimus_009060 [Dionaea muscipula]
MQFVDDSMHAACKQYLVSLAATDKAAATATAKKRNRVKLVVEAMEVGHFGIRTTARSAASSPKPIAAPSPDFPRLVLVVSIDSPFLQSIRLTVSLDSSASAQASALSSGNAILKTYDLVVVRPLNLNASEQACPFSERGVYSEINYPCLIEDAQMRRQLMSH